MNQPLDNLTAHLIARIIQVQQNLGLGPSGPVLPLSRFVDVLDSMGLVEFLALLAEDCQINIEAIEQATGSQFDTIAQLARSMQTAGIRPVSMVLPDPSTHPAPGSLAGASDPSTPSREAWLTAPAARLAETIQLASVINEAIGRPAGWLESHAGIYGRCIWADQDPLAAATAAARDCLDASGVPAEQVGALLVTSEAPPLLAGLAAALHFRMALCPSAVALEIGGACTGFLACLWTAQPLLPRVGPVLVIAVEAPSRFFHLQPGPAGEAAALFGDGAAACLLCDRPATTAALRLTDITLGSDGGQAHLIQLERSPAGALQLRLAGPALAGRAVRTMARAVLQMAARHGLAVADLQAVIAHPGNGRMPALLARQLGLPPDRVCSQVADTGNLGSASLPATWAAIKSRPTGPVAWTAAGAGLTWAAALTSR